MKLFNKIAVVIIVFLLGGAKMTRIARFACIMLILSGHLSAYAGLNRTSGVAPLAIHFSAGLTASTPGNMPFHDYEYAWDFGDSGSRVWGTSGKSKNTDKGAVAAHVYETPGTYTATLTVRDRSGVIDTDTFTITVQDPEVVFAGDKTTCLSTGADFTGCPTGATQVTTDNLSNLSGYTAAGERLLFRRGDSWTVSAEPVFASNAGPVHIGAFGECLSPDSSGICSNAPSISMASERFLSFGFKQDWRISDISITSASESREIITSSQGTKNFLVLRMRLSSGYDGFSNSSGRSNDEDYPDGEFIFDSRIENMTRYVVYIGGERVAIMGCVLKDSFNSHVLRAWQGYQMVVAHNFISGAGGSNGHAFKYHGPSEQGTTGLTFVGTYAETGDRGLRNFSKFSVISNNVFGASGPWPVSIGPQNDVVDERVSDVLIEKNRVIADYGTPKASPVSEGIMVEGRYMTIRNNIIDGTGSGTTFNGIKVWRRGIEWTPLGNRVFNNTIFKPDNSNIFKGISIGESAEDTFVKNNYVSAPNSTGAATAVVDSSEISAVNSNSILLYSEFIDPFNNDPLTRNFELTSSATESIGKGTAIVPVFDDFLGLPRYGAMDIGAFRATPRRLFRNIRVGEVEP